MSVSERVKLLEQIFGFKYRLKFEIRLKNSDKNSNIFSACTIIEEWIKEYLDVIIIRVI